MDRYTLGLLRRDDADLLQKSRWERVQLSEQEVGDEGRPLRSERSPLPSRGSLLGSLSSGWNNLNDSVSKELEFILTTVDHSRRRLRPPR